MPENHEYKSTRQPITVKELTEDIKAGKRDFTCRVLEPSRLLTPQELRELNSYSANLRLSTIGDFRYSPINISYSDFQGFFAPEIYLPYLRAVKTFLTKANLSRADLREADFTHACLREADLSGANLYGADLKGADLTSICLHRADIRDVRNLGSVTGLTAECFHKTRVTQEEKEIIEKLIKPKDLFVVIPFWDLLNRIASSIAFPEEDSKK